MKKSFAQIVFLVLTCTLVTINSNSFGQVTLLDENFNSTIPGSWSIVDYNSDFATWKHLANRVGSTLDGTGFVICDSDADGNGIWMNDELLITPVINCSSYTSLTLEFDQYLNHIAATGEYGAVDVWNGTAWVNVLMQTTDVGGWSPGANHQSINILTHANNNLQVRFRYNDGNVWAWYWAIDNVKISGYPPPTPMKYISCTTTQDKTNSVLPGALKVEIANLQVYTLGNLSPILDLKSIKFNMNGTTTLSYVDSVHLYYTGNDNTFNTNNLLGSFVPSTGTITYTGTQALSQGRNNFWIAYDISPSAPLIGAEFVDAECTEITIDSASVVSTYTPTVTAPAGNRQIKIEYCASNATSNAYDDIGNVTLTQGSNVLLNNGVNTNPITNNPNANATYTDYTNLTPPQLVLCQTFDIAVTQIQLTGWYNCDVKVYIDLNRDGDFEDINEMVFGGTTSLTNNPLTGSFTINSAQYGVTGMRVVLDETGLAPPCGTYLWGETEDYLVEIIPPAQLIADFAVDDTICYLTPTVVYNASIFSSTQDWFVNGVHKSNDFNLEHSFTNMGYNTITLIAANCIATDTFTDSVYAASPTAAPIADFVASKNVIEVYESVIFYNLTNNCPGYYQWSVSPDSVYIQGLGMTPTVQYINSTSRFSQNPNMQFNNSGVYEICLISSNSLGGDTICKPGHIIVKGSAYMCAFPMSSDVDMGKLYDDGGPTGNYSSGHNGTNMCEFLIEPCASEVILEFSEFSLGADDYLRIYDGKDNTGIPLWDNVTYPNGIEGTMTHLSFDTTYIATNTGMMFIEFESDNNTGTVSSGFIAEWSIVPGSFTPPVASFNVDDSVCVGIPIYFENTSTGDYLDYVWDFDVNDGFNDAFTKDATHSYQFTGTYTAKLTIRNCGGISSVTKNMVVNTPMGVPPAGFYADILRPAQGLDVVSFFDTSRSCIDYWKWEFSPNLVQFVNSTNLHSINPQVVFMDTGCFNVSMIVGNINDTDTIHMPCYIYAINYCLPSVGNLIPDLGISKVQIGSINNSTSIGVAAFTDYSGTHHATVEVGGSYQIILERNTTINPMDRKVWIDYNRNGNFTDASELVSHESNAYTLSWTDTIVIPQTALSGVTTMRIGASYGNHSNDPCGLNMFGEFEDYRIIIIPDELSPVITLIGSDTIYSELGYNYNDQGATAMDNVDGNLTSAIITTNTVDTTIIGTYYVQYDVTDYSSNSASKQRIIIITLDATPPLIVLNGGDTVYVEVYNTYSDAGATAWDNIGSNLMGTNISGSIIITNNVDTSELGTYIITYQVTDGAGNSSSKNRVVIIRDTQNPVVSLKGSNPVNIEVNTTYVDSGVNQSDNYWTNLIPTITITVDTSTLGTYYYQYCFTDSSGNGPECISRTVNVYDSTAPVASLINAKDDTIIVEVFDAFVKPGINVIDNYYTTFTTTRSGTFYNSFPSGIPTVIGDYTIIYEYTDGSGNMGTLTIVVRVVDTEAPVLALLGLPVVMVPRWSVYSDPGYTVFDNYENIASIDIDTLSSLNMLVTGLYYIQYTATDQSGNVSTPVIRVINVYQPLNISEKGIEKFINIYPNPSNGHFVIDIELPQHMNLNICVLNTLGETIKQIESGMILKKRFEVDLGDVSEGMYLIRIESNDQVFVKNILITR